MLRLNSHFANRCAAVYYRYREHIPPSGALWSLALQGYKKKPNELARLLPLMAAAHMIEDLPNSIHACHPVNKGEFDAIFEQIVQCVEVCRRLHQISSRAWADVLRDIKGSIPIPVRPDAFRKILFAFGVAVAWLPPMLNPGIKQIREFAWKIALAKIEISS